MRVALFVGFIAVVVSGCVARETVVGTLDGGGPADIGGPAQLEPFTQQGEVSIGLAREPVSITRLQGSAMSEVVAVLSLDGRDARVDVLDFAHPANQASVTIPLEVGRSIIGFNYELGSGAARPVLAIATSQPTGLKIHLYDWDPAAYSLTPIDVLAETCFNWVCGTQSACQDTVNCQANEVCTDRWACGATQPCTEKRCALENTAVDTCGALVPTPPAGCGCKLKVDFGTEVSMAVTDIDGDGKNDLVVATSSDLPFVQYLSSNSGATGSGPGTALYRPQGCQCGRYAQAPDSFALLNFGGSFDGAPESAASGSRDLVIGAPGGAFVKYANRAASGDVILNCGQPARIGDLKPVRDLAIGRFACNPLQSTTCDAYEDLVVVAAQSLGGGSFDDPGSIRVIYGGSADLSTTDTLANGSQELVPSRFPGREDPKDPRTAQVRDFNDDGNDDLGVLFGGGSHPEVHFWLGSGQPGLRGADFGVIIDSVSPCNAHRRWAAPDVDGDGRPEVVVICDANAENATIRWYRQGP